MVLGKAEFSHLIYLMYIWKFLLNKQDVGCCINGRVINHLVYADVSVLLAPSVKGLQKLINIVSDYGLEHNILFNKTKTVVCIS